VAPNAILTQRAQTASQTYRRAGRTRRPFSRLDGGRQRRGLLTGNYEPIAWAEELIEPARAVDHPRLAALYEMASHCYFVGRIDAAVRYSDAGQTIVASGRDYALPFGGEGVLVGPYLAIGQPERVIEWCRAQLALGRDALTSTQTMLVMALTTAGSVDEARIAAEGLIDAAEATRNPYVLSLALGAYGFAIRNTDPARAREALRRGMVIAHESGNSFTEATLAVALSTLEAAYGDTLDALDHISAAIRTWFDAGNTTAMRPPLAVLAVLLDRLGRYEPAAKIAGFALSPLVATGFSEITTAIAHLRDVFGDQTYESLARKGETMTITAMATYAYDQIDQARAELEHPS